MIYKDFVIIIIKLSTKFQRKYNNVITIFQYDFFISKCIVKRIGINN